ncbi:FKBP-type peptidyl-prolyl cis-trans isomerase SlyD [Rosistilla oblonga]|uniref:Peptidyl-prolyl cis-trans isomerase n=1 Tax=Rosistilla oblonga TaxID=2527990 RepID=A0A518J1T2_9BACT|nr:peptidylprolyl isomerase [Rosistilla oblonga]QDV12583.1 FKBP-type peptidyl-prolyl cis-trans isomerase SlyD [Rosistilla oblonga]QDV59295.1 FKBP-type peptidyl-prolyl cis-trans isomerase SlyD [Rosistilla oblonga]
MQITADKVVAFDYKLTDDAGELIDSSEGHEPLLYLHGQGGIIEGLERALEGLKVGDTLNITIPPEDGYGLRSDELLQEVPRDEFEEVDEFEVGMQFEADTPDGPMIFSITEVGDELIKVDGNHPLAGETLTFDVTIREVRDATAEELEHGHAHGDGGHDHD